MMSSQRILTTKIFGVIFFSILMAGGVRFVLTPWKVYVTCDHYLEMELRKSLIGIIEKQPIRSVGIQQLCSDMKKDYPIIRALSVSYKGSLAAYVTVHSYTPWVCLASGLPGQKEYIVCKEGVVLEKKYFDKHIVERLPSLTIQGNDYSEAINDVEVLHCAQELRRDIFADYFITWKSKVEVIAESKSDHIVIVADALTIHEKERFGFVSRIFASESERYKSGMKADIRFRDEIICSPL